jgi:hypothetical protein
MSSVISFSLSERTRRVYRRGNSGNSDVGRLVILWIFRDIMIVVGSEWRPFNELN